MQFADEIDDYRHKYIAIEERDGRNANDTNSTIWRAVCVRDLSRKIIQPNNNLFISVISMF